MAGDITVLVDTSKAQQRYDILKLKKKNKKTIFESGARRALDSQDQDRRIDPHRGAPVLWP